MGRKSKFTLEQKNKACLDYINGYDSFENIDIKINICYNREKGGVL